MFYMTSFAYEDTNVSFDEIRKMTDEQLYNYLDELVSIAYDSGISNCIHWGQESTDE